MTRVIPPELLVIDAPAKTAKLAAPPRLILATGAAVTVKLVLAVCTPCVAVIFVTPAAIAVACPVDEILATLPTLEFQLTVLLMLFVVPFE